MHLKRIEMLMQNYNGSKTFDSNITAYMYYLNYYKYYRYYN